MSVNDVDIELPVWRGSTLAFDNRFLSESYIKVKKAITSLNNDPTVSSYSGNAALIERRSNSIDEIIGTLLDAIAISQKDLEMEKIASSMVQTSDSDERLEKFVKIQTYFLRLKLVYSIERNSLGISLNEISGKLKESIKLIDNILTVHCNILFINSYRVSLNLNNLRVLNQTSFYSKLALHN